MKRPCNPLTRQELHDIANRVMLASIRSGQEELGSDFRRLVDERNYMLQIMHSVMEHTSSTCQTCKNNRKNGKCPWDELRSFVANAERAA